MSTILALDIGTEFVKAVLAKPTKKGDLEILGVGKAHQAEGNMNAGAVADIPAVVSVCEEALVDVEEQAGERANRFEYSGGSSDEHVVNPISLIDRYIAGFSKDRYQVFEFDANGEPEEKNWE